MQVQRNIAVFNKTRIIMRNKAFKMEAKCFGKRKIVKHGMTYKYMPVRLKIQHYNVKKKEKRKT